VAQEGGFPAALLALLAPIAGEVVSDVYKFVKNKISGSGLKTSHIKSHHDKRKFLIQFLNNLE
jgi:hypothetical protein